MNKLQTIVVSMLLTCALSAQNNNYLGISFNYGFVSDFDVAPSPMSFQNSFFNRSNSGLGNQLGMELNFQHDLGSELSLYSSFGLRFYNTGIVASVPSSENINPFTNMYPVHNYDFNKDLSILQFNVITSIRHRITTKQFDIKPEIGLSLGYHFFETLGFGHFYRENNTRKPVFIIDLVRASSISLHPLIALTFEKKLGSSLTVNLGPRWIGGYNFIGNNTAYEGKYELFLTSGNSRGSLSNNSGRLEFLGGISFLLNTKLNNR